MERKLLYCARMCVCVCVCVCACVCVCIVPCVIGWLVEPDDSHDPEGVTLLKWVQARLKAAIKQK